MSTSKLKEYYRKLFSIEEIEQSKPLQALLAVSLFVFYITFDKWSPSLTISVENARNGYHLCWPYFKNCGDWYFLSSLPFGYSQNFFYMILFTIMTLIAIAIWKKRWCLAHFGLALLLFWEILFIFVLNISKRGNYDYYQIILTSILLFLPFKFSFLRITFCCLYFLASSIKIHAGWVLGTYYTSLNIGIPIFPEEMTPLATNTVIFMEMIGSWFLLSRRRFWQRAALVFFITFHLYSGIIVWYRYPATILPYLLILFFPLYETEIPLTKRALPGWILIAFLFLMQSVSFLIPKDAKLTFEGMNYGLYMFDSNHQCASTTKVFYESGKQRVYSKEMDSARSRCDPYYRLFKIWNRCNKGGYGVDKVEKVKWQFIHSINGGPFYKIVDVENACELDYKPFSHNEWILTPEDGAKLMGYPVKNLYY